MKGSLLALLGIAYCAGVASILGISYGIAMLARKVGW